MLEGFTAKGSTQLGRRRSVSGKKKPAATIRTLADEPTRGAEMRESPPRGLLAEKIVELMSGVEGLAGFSTRQSMESFRQEALAAISRLEHPNLFGRLDE